MKVVDGYRGTSGPVYSFEFFPPRTDEGVATLFDTLRDLAPLGPGFVSVTYGAGGSTRERIVEIVTRIRQETGVEAVAHLASIGHTRGELRQILGQYRDAGIGNVIALRGDPPRDGTAPGTTELQHASDLARFIRDEGFDFCLGGACYPEGHLEAESREIDLENLKRKLEAGCQFLITQLFFDNAFYFHFLERARAAGITAPIIPGIMPITNFEQIDRFTRLCGATIPMRLRLALERYRHDPDAILQLGVAHATVQCVDLLRAGVPGIHFYTLNRSRASRMIFAALQQERPKP